MATAAMSVWALLRPVIMHMSSRGFDVHVISAPGRGLERLRALPGVTVHPIPLRRRINLFWDLVSLLRLCLTFLQLRPDIVHANTPKAGLLGMTAAFVTRIKVRVLTINGLPSMTETGWRRSLLTASDRLACFLATRVLTVSQSLRGAITKGRLCPPRKVVTLGFGSSHGIDVRRFNLDSVEPAHRAEVRRQYAIPQHSVLIGYVGRLVRDKGVEDLAAAWSIVRRKSKDLHLLLCGDFEADDAVRTEVRAALLRDERVHVTAGFVDDMPPMYSAMDICVLPTYREGLPNVCLEASAMRIPVIATCIPGCVDAVEDEVTGLLVRPRDPESLASALLRLAIDPDLRRHLGEAGRQFVETRFSEDTVCELLFSEYIRLVPACGVSLRKVAGRTLDQASE
jgi:glycosyltransferase involved in cell wall biosynthesis